MKPIGKIIKEERKKKNISLDELSQKTKIKKDFIKAIEKENWKLLPEFPVVLGFVKNISDTLGIGSERAAALLKRDFPPKEKDIERINPKPDVAKEFIWSPKLTFILGIILVTLALFCYLIFQYIKFVSPPKLTIQEPSESQVVTQEDVTVKGSTDLEATITVNNQPVIVDENGNFETEIEVAENTKEVRITARSRAGKETIIKRNIDVKLK